MLPGAAGLLAAVDARVGIEDGPLAAAAFAQGKYGRRNRGDGHGKGSRRRAVVCHNHRHAGLPRYFVGHNRVDLALRDEDQRRGHIVKRDRDIGQRGRNGPARGRLERRAGGRVNRTDAIAEDGHDLSGRHRAWLKARATSDVENHGRAGRANEKSHLYRLNRASSGRNLHVCRCKFRQRACWRRRVHRQSDRCGSVSAGRRHRQEVAAGAGQKVAVNGALVPAAVLVTWTLCVPGIDMEPASTLNETAAGGERNGGGGRSNIQRHGNIERTGPGAWNDHSYYARVSSLRKLRPVRRDSYCVSGSGGSKPAGAAQDGRNDANCRSARHTGDLNRLAVWRGAAGGLA